MALLLTTSRYCHCIILGIFLILDGYSCNCTKITITRNDSLDVFTIPQTNCNTFCSAKKSLVLRSTPSSCACRCHSNASTFVFKGELTSSVCMDNIKMRSTLGQCQLLLDHNTITSPLPVLDLSIPGTRILTGPVNGSSTCSVYQEEVLVNGTWAAGAGGNLTIFTADKNLLKWSSISPGSPYTGRVVRVQLHCDAKNICVIIKTQGSISYNVPTPVIPISIALQPSPTTSYIKPVGPSSSTKHGTSRVQFTSSKTKNLIPLDPATISPTLATVVMVSSSAVVIGGTKAVQDVCERGAWVFCQRFYLGIAAVGMVVVLVLVIILISCACRIRRRRRNLRHQKPVFFKAGLTNLMENDSSTELALIEDAKPKNEDHKGQNNEEAFYQNVPRREKPDKNQLYRPLRSSDGRDSPTSPATPASSAGRFSYGSSTNELILYDDNTDSNQLIKHGSQSSTPAVGKRLKTFCPSPVVQSKKEFLSNQAVLDPEEEATYEIMETKTLPHSGKKSRANNESITGFENRVFEEEEHRQSHYDVVADEQPNYENVEGDYQEEQTNYETMEEHRNGVGLNAQKEGKDYSGVDHEEQENYETMDTLSGEEQPNYVTMDTLSGEEQPNYETMDQVEKAGEQKLSLMYEKMGSHNKDCDPDNEFGKEKMENEREYDIPVLITEDEHESHYDIPELSLEVQQEEDEPDYHYVVNTGGHNKSTGLTVPSDLKHDNGDNDGDYVYANVPEIQANELREKLRNSWHSGGQHGEEASRGNKTVAEKPGTEKRPSSWNTSVVEKTNNKTVHKEDGEELYSLPEDFPKPLPSCLLKGRSSPQLKQAQAKNQVFPKQKQRSEQMKPKDGDGVQSRVPLGNPKTSKPGAKTNVPVSNIMKKDKSSLEQPGNLRVGKPSTAGRETNNDRPEHSEREGKTPAKKNKSEGLINEQPLYTNLVEMENEGQILANENTDEQTDQNLIDQQPLYENVGAMVSHVG